MTDHQPISDAELEEWACFAPHGEQGEIILRLIKEVERLKAYQHDAADRFVAVVRQRDEAEAEVRRLKAESQDSFNAAWSIAGRKLSDEMTRQFYRPTFLLEYRPETLSEQDRQHLIELLQKGIDDLRKLEPSGNTR